MKVVYDQVPKIQGYVKTPLCKLRYHANVDRASNDKCSTGLGNKNFEASDARFKISGLLV